VIDDARPRAVCRSRSAVGFRCPRQVTVRRVRVVEFVSALLLAGARYDKGIEVGARRRAGVVSGAAHRDDRRHAGPLRGFEVTQPTAGRRGTSPPGPISAQDVVIEPDLSERGTVPRGGGGHRRRGHRHGWPTTDDPAGRRPARAADPQWRRGGTGHGACPWRAPAAIRRLDPTCVTSPSLVNGDRGAGALAGRPSHLTGLTHMRGPRGRSADRRCAPS